MGAECWVGFVFDMEYDVAWWYVGLSTTDRHQCPTERYSEPKWRHNVRNVDGVITHRFIRFPFQRYSLPIFRPRIYPEFHPLLLFHDLFPFTLLAPTHPQSARF